jgi:hypothetical protein
MHVRNNGRVPGWVRVSTHDIARGDCEIQFAVIAGCPALSYRLPQDLADSLYRLKEAAGNVHFLVPGRNRPVLLQREFRISRNVGAIAFFCSLTDVALTLRARPIG